MPSNDLTTTAKNTSVMVGASSAYALAAYLVREGYDPAALEREMGMSLEWLQKPDQRLPLETYNRLWDLAIDFKQDPALGLHLGEMTSEENMGVVSHIFFNNPTLGAALEQFSRLFQLVNEGMQAQFTVDDKLAYLKYVWLEPEYYSIPNMDRTMSISVNRARVYLKSSLKIEYVTFEHPAPDYLEEYKRIFQCPVLFEQPCCSIVFDKQYLAYEIPRRNPYLHQVLTRHVQPLLRKLRARKSFSAQVRRLIRKSLAQNAFDAEHIAQRLHMSRHTLYRKLKAEGQSFQELTEAVRKEEALRLLDNQTYSLSEIAFLLGFSELSAFSRAFKRWTGKSPAQYIKDRKHNQ